MQTFIYVHGAIGSNSLLEAFKNYEDTVFVKSKIVKSRPEWTTYYHTDRRNYPGSLKLHQRISEIPLLIVRVIGENVKDLIGAFVAEMYQHANVVSIQVICPQTKTKSYGKK